MGFLRGSQLPCRDLATCNVTSSGREGPDAQPQELAFAQASFPPVAMETEARGFVPTAPLSSYF